MLWYKPFNKRSASVCIPYQNWSLTSTKPHLRVWFFCWQRHSDLKEQQLAEGIRPYAGRMPSVKECRDTRPVAVPGKYPRRPLPLAQVASSAAGSAPIAPLGCPKPIIRNYALRKYRRGRPMCRPVLPDNQKERHAGRSLPAQPPSLPCMGWRGGHL